MAKKRGQGEGSIVAYGKRWRAFVTLSDGRRSKICDTKQQAREWIWEMTGQKKKGITVASSKTTLKDFLEEWIEIYARSVKPNSVRLYKSVMKNHIIPAMGDLKLGDIKAKHIDRGYSIMAENGASKHILFTCHAVLSRAMNYAVNSDIIPVSPVSRVKRPRPPKKEIDMMTEEEMARFLATVSGHRLEAYFYLAVVTGMRKMEIAGLTWDNIDWNNRVIQVRQQVDVHGEFVPLKNPASRRDIDITEQDVQVLIRHEARQKEEMERMGWKNEKNLVFLNLWGNPLGHSTITTIFNQLLEQAGLRHYKLHSLRHFNITFLLLNDEPILTVSRRAGHSSPTITLGTYGHYIRSYQRQTAETANLIVPTKVDNLKED